MQRFMDYSVRTAVPADEEKIRELFLEMLRTIYHTEDVEGYPAGYLRLYCAGTLSAEQLDEIRRIGLGYPGDSEAS